jgi:hypothetical protein
LYFKGIHHRFGEGLCKQTGEEEIAIIRQWLKRRKRKMIGDRDGIENEEDLTFFLATDGQNVAKDEMLKDNFRVVEYDGGKYFLLWNCLCGLIDSIDRFASVVVVVWVFEWNRRCLSSRTQ